MFKKYNTKIVSKQAMEIMADTQVHDGGNNIKCILVGEELVQFSHNQPVEVGDYVIRLSDDDIYHCPRDVFHNGHVEDVSTPEQRVKEELAELSTKLVALQELLAKERPSFISEAMWERMDLQECAMSEYQYILSDRLDMW